jgi:hypothetical protein
MNITTGRTNSKHENHNCAEVSGRLCSIASGGAILLLSVDVHNDVLFDLHSLYAAIWVVFEQNCKETLQTE